MKCNFNIVFDSSSSSDDSDLDYSDPFREIPVVRKPEIKSPSNAELASVQKPFHRNFNRNIPMRRRPIPQRHVSTAVPRISLPPPAPIDAIKSDKSNLKNLKETNHTNQTSFRITPNPRFIQKTIYNQNKRYGNTYDGVSSSSDNSDFELNDNEIREVKVVKQPIRNSFEKTVVENLSENNNVNNNVNPNNIHENNNNNNIDQNTNHDMCKESTINKSLKAMINRPNTADQALGMRGIFSESTDQEFVEMRTFTAVMKKSKKFFKSSYSFAFFEKGEALYKIDNVKSIPAETLNISDNLKIVSTGGSLEFTIQTIEQFSKQIAKIRFNPPDFDDECQRKTIIKLSQVNNKMLPPTITSLSSANSDIFGGHYYLNSIRNVALVVPNTRTPVLTILEVEKNRIDVRTNLNIPEDLIFGISLASLMGSNSLKSLSNILDGQSLMVGVPGILV